MDIYQARQKEIYEDSILRATDPEGYYEAQARIALFNNYRNNLISSIANSGRFQFRTLGMVNIDRIQRDLIAKGTEVIVDAFDQNGDSLTLETISILSTNLPGAFSYSTNKIYMLKTGSTVAIAKTINGDLGYISKQSMKAITFNAKGSTKFVFNVINPDDITVEELGRLIY